MEDSEIILAGPEFTGPEYLGSIAEYLIPKMKSWPKNFITQMDCATGEFVTGHDFLRQSLEVTEGLIEFGLKEGDVIILACSNNIRSHITATGILLSGIVLAPIDKSLKPFELQHFFKLFQPKCIICETVKFKEIQDCVKSSNLDSKIILIDSDDSNGEFIGWSCIRKKEVDVKDYTPRTITDSKKSIALINCSSGSTGLPKGVALSHYALLYNLTLMDKVFAPGFGEKFLLNSPLFWFSGSILLINSCFFGLTRYVPKSTAVEDILKGIEECKPAYILMVPSQLISLVEHPDFYKYDLSSVKIISSAGATLGTNVAEKIKKIWKGILLSNNYGLTETCGQITVNYGLEDASAVGKLLPEVKVKIVDMDTGKSLGPNKVGECRIKTKRVMNGYYNNEEATKATYDEKGWFRTGDLLYYDEEGVLYFFGRKKEIIQYKHYQISPSEIQSFIISLPGVKDVAVVPIPDEVDTNHIRALVVKDPNFDITAEEIIKEVKENLSERKNLTGGVQFVNALPRTEAGKLRMVEAQKMTQISNS